MEKLISFAFVIVLITWLENITSLSLSLPLAAKKEDCETKVWGLSYWGRNKTGVLQLINSLWYDEVTRTFNGENLPKLEALLEIVLYK